MDENRIKLTILRLRDPTVDIHVLLGALEIVYRHRVNSMDIQFWVPKTECLPGPLIRGLLGWISSPGYPVLDAEALISRASKVSMPITNDETPALHIHGWLSPRAYPDWRRLFWHSYDR
ncbi:hypothetical protein FHL15_011166 [Xylaria flabelliformis]|uniref:Uncharacterized protein n=1 Tax=Xylaria flabelliformis TaxID=2512241 RepID=A0A553HJ24_9PEZI|nr:hypothetical protein FHL15_011166 [Xylaria flabelliformis]